MPVHYPFLLDPRKYPDFSRRGFSVPTWETFENQPQFTALRDLSMVKWRDELDMYTKEFNLGRVIWPLIHLLWSSHVKEVIEEIKNHCVIDSLTAKLLEGAIETLGLSARAYDKTLKLARTIADLAGEEFIDKGHVLEALSYRKK